MSADCCDDPRHPHDSGLAYWALLAALALLLAFAVIASGCTQVDRRTTLAGSSPPLPDELPGAYAIDWNPTAGGPRTIASGGLDVDVATFDHFPCFSLAGQTAVGGTYDYDLAGHFHCEAKTLGGDTKVTVDGAFSSDFSMSGTYEVRFLGSLCEAGVIQMRRSN